MEEQDGKKGWKKGKQDTRFRIKLQYTSQPLRFLPSYSLLDAVASHNDSLRFDFSVQAFSFFSFCLFRATTQDASPECDGFLRSFGRVGSS